jgi:tetratricopeptide (TPR) repeat protein
VAEIDPGVTKAAIAAFGLKEDSSIKTIPLDARNYVDSLLEDQQQGKTIPHYDFIYEDAFSDYNVPFQLVTKEFHDKIDDILTDDGVYMINMIDVLDKAYFLSAYLNTLRQTFPHVYVVTENAPESFRMTFSILASKVEIDVEESIQKYRPGYEYRFFDQADTQEIAAKAEGLILTDDYAPAENLLAATVKQSSIEFLTHRYRTKAHAAKREGNLTDAIHYYEKMIETDFAVALEAYNDMGILYAQLGQRDNAIKAFQQAIDANETIKPKQNLANVHFSLAVALQSAGRPQEAAKEFDLAIESFQIELAKKPDAVKYLMLIGDSYASKGDFLTASEFFTKAVNKEPHELTHHIKRIQALEYAGRIPEALSAAQQAYGFFTQYQQHQAAAVLRQYIDRLEKNN